MLKSGPFFGGYVTERFGEQIGWKNIFIVIPVAMQDAVGGIRLVHTAVPGKFPEGPLIIQAA